MMKSKGLIKRERLTIETGKLIDYVGFQFFLIMIHFNFCYTELIVIVMNKKLPKSLADLYANCRFQEILIGRLRIKCFMKSDIKYR